MQAITIRSLKAESQKTPKDVSRAYTAEDLMGLSWDLFDGEK